MVFLRATRYYFLLTNHSIHTIKGTEQNLIKILSTGSLKTLKPLILLGFRTFSIYSHSIVPIGLGVRSITTRLIPSTSWVMRSVMWCRSAVGDLLDGGGHGVGGVHRADDCRPALIALAVAHAHALEVGHGDEVLPYLAGKTVLVKLLSEDGVRFSQRRSGGLGVIAPRQRTPSPGPGNGWRYTMLCGRPRASPTTRTSSLKSSFTGSTSSIFMSSGRPPTLW